MDLLEPVLRLNRLGQFGAALRALEQTFPGQTIHSSAQALRAELLEQVGESHRALGLATALLRTRHLTTSQRCECEVLVSRVLIDDGDTEGGLAHLQRAALLGQQGTEPHAQFVAKLAMLDVLSDRSGPAAVASILAEVRQIATRLGDPQVTARLHVFVAQIEARRGLLDNAMRHTSIARRILDTSPNA